MRVDRRTRNSPLARGGIRAYPGLYQSIQRQKGGDALTTEAHFLTNLWYMAGLSATLKPGAMRREMLCGEPVLIGRGMEGGIFALRDICPHRAAPLSAGRIREGTVECPYHGWRFKPDGVCAHIPSVLQEGDIDVARIKVRSYPAKEQDGLIWVYFAADAKSDAAPSLDPPRIPIGAGDGRAVPRFVESQMFPCEVDHAVVGLMDPAHGPFVHTAWWWRSRRSIQHKAKAFAPSPFGFTMTRHLPSRNSRGYRLLGGAPDTEIIFRLPSIRIEQIRAGRHRVGSLTAITPVDDRTTEINHCIYWTPRWFGIVKPVLRHYVRAFLHQDREIMERQQQGLRFDPPLTLIEDADTQAKWYFRLKREYRLARAEERPFENPVEPRTLRWRS